MRVIKVDRIHQKETIFEISMSKTHIDFFSKISFFHFFSKKNWPNGTNARRTSTKNSSKSRVGSNPGQDTFAQNCTKIVYGMHAQISGSNLIDFFDSKMYLAS